MESNYKFRGTRLLPINFILILHKYWKQINQLINLLGITTLHIPLTLLIIAAVHCFYD